MKTNVEPMRTSDALFASNGTRYWRAGRGESVILIHGVGLDATIWEAQVASLSEHYDVIAYDMLGHGESPAPSPESTLQDYATQLHELIESLGLNNVAIVGFSMGGLVARMTAITTPEKVRCMVILASVFERNEAQIAGILKRLEQVRQNGPQASIEQALKRWFSEDYRQHHPEQIERIHQLVTSNKPGSYYISYSLFGREDNAGRSHLGKLEMPILVATGEKDPGSTPAMARALANALPNASCRILPGMKHMLIMEHPGTINTMLHGFLSQHQHAIPSKEMLS